MSALRKTRYAAFSRLMVIVALWMLSPCASQAQSELPEPAESAVAAPFSGLAKTPSANLFSGAATAEIQFEVPPGRMDMTPALALRYASTAGESPYGFGWTLPVGRITRSLADGVPAYVNGQDTFVLELPSQTVELVAAGGAQSKSYRAKYESGYLRVGFEHGSENYWIVFDKNGTKYTFGRRQQARHSRIERFANDSSHSTYSWLLETAEDAFGNRVEYFYEAPLTGENVPRGLPRRVEYGGRLGKDHPFSVEFVWASMPYPAKPRSDFKAGFARYAGGCYLAGVKTFLREGNGKKLIREYHLDYEQEVETSGSFTLVGVSLRAHAESGSFVDVPPSVFRYAPAMQTDWPSGAISVRGAHVLAFDGPGEIRDAGNRIGFDTFDINGDALPDYVDGENGAVRFGTGTGLEDPVAWPWPQGHPYVRDTRSGKLRRSVLDLTGDGLPDFVDADCNGGVSEWCVYRNLGNGFAASPQVWAAPLGRNYLRYTEPRPNNQSALVADTLDMNGDGRADFVDTTAYTSSNPVWRVAYNLGDRFVSGNAQLPAPSSTLAAYVYPSAPGCQLGWERNGMADMNGDGLRDYVVADTGELEGSVGCNSETHWNVYYNTGGGFELVPQAWSVEGANYALPHYLNVFVACSDENASTSANLIDMNSDGRPDFLAPHTFDNCGDSEHVPPLCENTTCDSTHPEFPANCCINMVLLVNTGSSFAAPTGWGSPRAEWVSRSTYPSDYTSARWELMDFDGDGLVDLLENQPSGDPVTGEITGYAWSVYRNPASPFATGSNTPDVVRTRPNLMVAMMNGIGGETMLEYTSVAQMGVRGCVYSSQGVAESGNCVPFAYWAVTHKETLDVFSSLVYRTGEPAIEMYAYSDGYYDAREREFRGFGLVWRTDALGMTRAVEYHQDDARKGLVHDAYELGNPGCAWNPGGLAGGCNPYDVLMSHTHVEWPEATEGSSLPVLVQSEVTTPFELPAAGGAPIARADLTKSAEYLYDSYGNVRTKTVEHTTTEFSVSSGPQERLVRTTTHTDYEIDAQSDSNGLPLVYNVSRPLSVRTLEDGVGPVAQRKFIYKNGLLRRTSICASWDANGECTSGGWSNTEYRMNKDGLLKASRTPLRGTRRIRYGRNRLYPSDLKDEAKLETEEYHDLRHGKVRRTVGIDGSEHITKYDGLGRPLEIWGPDLVGRDASFLEIAHSYVEPYIDPADLGASRPGYVLREAAGEPPVATFYDGSGGVIATKTLRQTDAGQRALVAGVSISNGIGQRLRTAVPFDSGEADPPAGFSALPTSLIADVPGWTDYFYDAVTGRVTETRLPAGERFVENREVPGVRASADAEFSADPSKGRVRIEFFDGGNRKVGSEFCSVLPTSAVLSDGCPQGALLEKTSYAYDGLGRVTEVVQHRVENPGESFVKTLNRYDGAGNKIYVFDVDSGEWFYEYNGTGGLKRSISPNGDIVDYEYDKAGRIQAVVEHAGSGGQRVTNYRYVRRGNGAGQPDSIAIDSNHGYRLLKTFGYNARGSVISVRMQTHSVSEGDEYDSDHTVSYGYSLPNRLISATYPDGQGGVETIVTGYNTNGDPVSLISAEPGGRVYVADTEYDIYGNLVSLLHGNGVRDAYSYFPPTLGGYLACLRTTVSPIGNGCQSGTGDLQGLWLLGHDANGRLTGVLDRVHAPGLPHSNYHEAEYDRMGRLVRALYGTGAAADEDTFGYDSVGNMAEMNGEQRVFDPVHPHRMTGFAGATYAYDPNGNVTVNGSGHVFSYDARNRLRLVRTGPQIVQSNHYDELNLRSVRSEPGSGVKHIYGKTFEVDVESGEIARYFFLGDRRVASDRVGSGTIDTVFYHPDHLGSPQAITGESGDAVEYVRYRAFGQVRGVFVESGGTIVPKSGGMQPKLATNLGFTGQQPDEETGLVYFGARFYDPNAARFMGHDPAEQFPSPYAYGGFDPLGGVDPDGAVFGLDDAAFALLIKISAISAGVSAAATLVATGDLGAALKAGVVTGVSSFTLGGVQAATMKQLLDAKVLTETATEVFRVAQLAYGVYGAASGGNSVVDFALIASAAFNLGSGNLLQKRVGSEGRFDADADYALQGLSTKPTSVVVGCGDQCHLRLRVTTKIVTADDAAGQFTDAMGLIGSSTVGLGVGGGKAYAVYVGVEDGKLVYGTFEVSIEEVGTKGVTRSGGLFYMRGKVEAGQNVYLSADPGNLGRLSSGFAVPGLAVSATPDGKSITGITLFYSSSVHPSASAGRATTSGVFKRAPFR